LGSHRVFIGIGANIEPEAHIEQALELMCGTVRPLALSTFCRTAPVGPAGQPEYVNGVLLGETVLDARGLKAFLREVESRLGRVRNADKYAARPIDLDIILFDDAIIREPDLCIPDPDLWERDYLARAVLELEPGLCVPGRGVRLSAAPCLDSTGAAPLAVWTAELRRRFLP